MVYILVIITHIIHNKSSWTFCVGSYLCTTLWTLLFEFNLTSRFLYWTINTPYLMEILTRRRSACKLSSKHSTTKPPRLEIKLQNQNMLKSHLVGMVGCACCCWETGKLCPGNGLSRSNSAMMAAMSSSSLLDPSSSGLIWKWNRVKINILDPFPQIMSLDVNVESYILWIYNLYNK